MSLLSPYLKTRLKAYREKMYDTSVEVRTITSATDSGDAYGRSSSPADMSTLITAQLAWGNRYGINIGQEGGLVSTSDVLVVTSMDNFSILSTPQTYLLIGDTKYSISRIEQYQDTNELVLQCDKMS